MTAGSIGLDDEVAICASLAAAIECIIGNDGRVWRREGEVEKEGGCFVGLLLNIFDRMLRRGRYVFVGIPIVIHGAGAAFPASFFNRLPSFGIHQYIGHIDDAIIFNPAVRREVDDGVAEVVVKAVRKRAVGDGL